MSREPRGRVPRSSVPPRNPSLQRVLWPAFTGVAIVAFVATGFLGAGRKDSRPFLDVDLPFVAGQFWLRGESPYDLAAFAPEVIAAAGYDPEVALPYPPQLALPAMALATLGLGGARIAMAIVSALSIAALALVTVRWARDAEVPRPAGRHPATGWMLAALVIGCPFASHLAWLGQISLPVAALLAWGWFHARRGRDVGAGVLLGLATLKPQFVVLPLLWLALERRWRLLAVAAATSVGLAVPAILSIGVGTAIGGWVEALAAYTAYEANRPGNPWVVGLPSLLAAVGVDGPGPVVWLAAIVPLVVLLFVARRRLCPDDTLGLLSGVLCALVYAHTNDLVLLAPLAAAVWLHIADRRDLWTPAALVTALLCVPQRLVHLAGVPLLEHWRTPLVLVSLVGLLMLSLRYGAAARRALG